MALDKLVDSTQLDADLTSVANAIRTKGGTSASLAFPAGFVSAIGDIPSGSNITWDDIATHNFSGDVTLDTATTIKESAFRESSITGINAPNVVTPGNSMFYKCYSLVSVNLPKMNGGSNDTSSCFSECRSLVNLYLPENGVMWNYFVNGCSALKTFVMPKLVNSRTTNFNGCSSLEKVDIGNANKAGMSIAGGFWNASPLLTILVLRYNTICSLSNINAFTGAFASGGTGGTIYVPNDLISSYQSASNWSTILGYTNNQIKSIESTHTDPNAPIDLTIYYADGTLIPT